MCKYQNQRSKQYSSAYLISEKLPVTNLLLHNKQSVKYSTFKFWNVYNSAFTEKDNALSHTALLVK
jgi:hypothetical protein